MNICSIPFLARQTNNNLICCCQQWTRARDESTIRRKCSEDKHRADGKISTDEWLFFLTWALSPLLRVALPLRMRRWNGVWTVFMIYASCSSHCSLMRHDDDDGDYAKRDDEEGNNLVRVCTKWMMVDERTQLTLFRSSVPLRRTVRRRRRKWFPGENETRGSNAN